VKKSTTIELSKNHRRSVSITLQLLDKALCEWDDWAHDKVRSGVMYREQDTFSVKQEAELARKIAGIRAIVSSLRDDLQLDAKTLATSQSVVGQAALLWEMLTSLNSQGLRGYGIVSGRLARYLDPIGDKLAGEMNAIAGLFSQRAESIYENDQPIQSPDVH